MATSITIGQSKKGSRKAKKGFVAYFFTFVDITNLESILRFVERVKNEFALHKESKDSKALQKDIKDFLDISEKILLLSDEPVVILKTLQLLEFLRKNNISSNKLAKDVNMLCDKFTNKLNNLLIKQ